MSTTSKGGLWVRILPHVTSNEHVRVYVNQRSGDRWACTFAAPFPTDAEALAAWREDTGRGKRRRGHNWEFNPLGG